MDQITNSADLATARLLEQFKNTPLRVAGVRAFAGVFDTLEQAIQDCVNLRQLANATGAQLDVWGLILDQPRNGMADNLYKDWLNAKALVNRSSGTGDDIIAVADAVCTPFGGIVALIEQPPAAVVVRVLNVECPYPAPIVSLLYKTKDAGVRLLFEFAGSDPTAGLFTLGDSNNSQPEIDATEGLGDTGNPATGGALIGVVVGP